MFEEAKGRNVHIEFQPSHENYTKIVQRHRNILEFTGDEKDGHTQKKETKIYKKKWPLPQNSEPEKKEK